MRRLTTFAAALALSAAPAAFAQDPAGGQAAQIQGQGQAGQARDAQGRPGARLDDRTFAAAAAAGDLAEIAAAQLALQQSQDSGVREYAQRLLEDHTRTSNQLKQMASAKNLQVPDRPDIKDQAAARVLATLTGPEFDREFAKSQVASHIYAVSLFKAQAKHGQDPELKAMAAEVLPHLQHHLEQAQRLAGVSGATADAAVRPAAATGADRDHDRD